MPPKKSVATLTALAKPKKPTDDSATRRWFDQLPLTIRKATRKAGQYEVCVENSGVVRCAQMRVDTYGWVTLLDVAPVADRPHVNMEVPVSRIIYVVEVPTMQPTFA
jgi:hypothetical protein